MALEAISNDVAIRAKRMLMIEEGKMAADRGELIPHDEVAYYRENANDNIAAKYIPTASKVMKFRSFVHLMLDKNL